MNKYSKLLNNIIYKIIRKILFSIFSFLDLIIPKDKRIIIFGAQRGVLYSDNSKYLYEYFNEKKSSEFIIYWATVSSEVFQNISTISSNNKIIMIYKIKSLWILCRAKTIVYSHGGGDFNNLNFSKKTNIIYLHHGIPIKNIGILGERFIQKENPKHLKRAISKLSLVVSSSPTERNNLSVCYEMSIDKIKITGYPRNDVLFKQSNILIEQYPFLGSKIILYAPTFRDNAQTDLFPFDNLNIEEINDFLKREDTYLLIRGHATETIFRKNSKVDTFESNRIIIANQDKFENVNELLPFVNILISDYSGIYIDFLLLNRPLIFIPYDLKIYQKERGLLFNYDGITPGPKVFTQKKLLEVLKNYLDNPNTDESQRKLTKNLFHTYQDGLSSERIYSEIKNMLNLGKNND